MGTESGPETPPVDGFEPSAAASPEPVERAEGDVAHLLEVEAALHANARAFGFERAVLHLHRLREKGTNRVGGYKGPETEAVNFSVNPTFASQDNQVHSLEIFEDRPPRLTVNFMGLVGPDGVMPQWFTKEVGDRDREGDTALRDFIDIFQHRILSLHFLAWRRTRFPAWLENEGREAESKYDPLKTHLLDLVGVGLDELRAHALTDDRALVMYAGLLAPQQRSAQALEQLIEDFFDVPVEVEQFIGSWIPVTLEHQCALDDGTASAQLGLGAVAGDEVWDQQSRVRLRLGPLSRKRFDEFLPGSKAYEELTALTRFFGRGALDFEVRLVLEKADVPAVVLGQKGDHEPVLSWSTWMWQELRERDADETILNLSEEGAQR